MQLATVSEKANLVLIVASGPSVKSLDLTLIDDEFVKRVHIIVVNRSALWFPRYHSFFTLDPDDKTLPIMQNQKEGVTYYAAVPLDYGNSDARIWYHRCDLTPNVKYLQRITGPGYLSSRAGLSENPMCIHTGNSAYGALGLAYHMKPKKIVLLGVDATPEIGYAYLDGRPRGMLFHLPNLFSSAALQLKEKNIQVLNGSAQSTVICFPRATPNHAVDWLLS